VFFFKAVLAAVAALAAFAATDFFAAVPAATVGAFIVLPPLFGFVTTVLELVMETSLLTLWLLAWLAVR